ncbi:MAG: hypothetical protein IJX47_09210 [Clostridia bacterium]|nr:hypothetical protein [Clostridia bacterium]
MALFTRDLYLEELERTDLRAAEEYLRMRAEKLNTDEALARAMGEAFWLLLGKDRLELTDEEIAVCMDNLTYLRQVAEKEKKGALLPALAGHLTERFPWYFADCKVDPDDMEATFRDADRRAAKLFAKALLADPRNPLSQALSYPRNPDGKRYLPKDVKTALLESLSGNSAIEFYLKNEIC